jgi:hypothetical protein
MRAQVNQLTFRTYSNGEIICTWGLTLEFLRVDTRCMRVEEVESHIVTQCHSLSDWAFIDITIMPPTSFLKHNPLESVSLENVQEMERYFKMFLPGYVRYHVEPERYHPNSFNRYDSP